MKPCKFDNNIKISPGFRVPENYFETFSVRLMSKMPEKEVKVISVFAQRKKWIYAIAAVFIVGISIPVLNKFYFTSTDFDKIYLENYIADQLIISDNDIADLLTYKDIRQMNTYIYIEDKTIENELLENDNVEEYLIN